MKIKHQVSQEYIKSVLNYDPRTGIFVWKKSHIKSLVGKIAGSLKSSGYIDIKIKGQIIRAHRLAWIHVYGHCDKKLDHKNRIKSDNRIDNLRETTPRDNSINTGIRSHNRSGVTGVCFARNRWRAQISIDGKQKYLGEFTSFSDAVNARKDAESLYGYTEVMEIR